MIPVTRAKYTANESDIPPSELLHTTYNISAVTFFHSCICLRAGWRAGLTVLCMLVPSLLSQHDHRVVTTACCDSWTLRVCHTLQMLSEQTQSCEFNVGEIELQTTTKHKQSCMPIKHK
jgi:hypothetical protein